MRRFLHTAPFFQLFRHFLPIPTIHNNQISPLSLIQISRNMGNLKGCRKLVLVPFPLQGHITPMLQLGEILNSRGFSITIAHTHFNSPNSINHPHLNFLPLPYGLTSLDPPPDGLVSFMSALKSTCEAPLLEHVTKIMQEEEKEGNSINDPVCIIYDGLMHFVGSVAHQLKLQSIFMSCGSATNLLMYHLLPSLKMNDSKLDELVPELHPIRFKDIPVRDFNEDELSWLASQSKATMSSSAIVLNTLECLEKPFLTKLIQSLDSNIPVFSIGPLHKIAPPTNTNFLEEDTSCMEWLDRQSPNSVVYVSLGSMACMQGKEMEEMASGLASSNQPFLWVIRGEAGCDPLASLPESFTGIVGGRGRGCIVKWAPQKLVLAHRAVGGFWSHCGWNSTLESISEGVPMICRPCFGDQMVNSRLVSHVFGVGYEVEDGFGRGEIERAIRMIMVDAEGEELRRRAMDLKEMFDLSVKESGSSYKSLNDLVKFLSC